MKDLVLVAINAKYIHTNLAVRVLKAQLLEFEIEILEMSINDSMHRIVQQLMDINTKVIGFSCYIWNIEIVFKVAEIIKKAKPTVQIMLGGPEVSFDGKALLEAYSFCDFIIQGEGENKLQQFMNNRQNLAEISGLCFRDENGIVWENPDDKSLALNDLTFAYFQNDLESLKHKIIYYETMRGCPFSCSYCLSSVNNGVKMLPLERVYDELDFFIQAGVKQVKLVDRTFNCNLRRTKDIFRYLIKCGGTTNFHFEMTGDLIDDEMILLLKNAPSGLIQFEIGIQSTDPITLKAIGRKISLTQTEKNVKKLLEAQNIHIHLDLIAGLPYETYLVFKSSFNRVIALFPNMLQLGFLKCLKGTRIRKEGDIHDYQYTSFPPYEIISNKYISSKELYQLRQIEVLVDRYFNSGAFKHSMRFIIETNLFDTPFNFFEQFSFYWAEQGYYDIGKSKEQLYGIIADFCEKHQKCQLLKEYLKFDFLTNGNLRLPSGMVDNSPKKEWIFEFLKVPQHIETYLSEFINTAPKKIYNQVKFQNFSQPFMERMFDEASVDVNKRSLLLFTEKSYQVVT